MKKAILSLLILFNTMLAESQGLFIDSLKRALTEDIKDTTRIMLNCALGEAYLRLNPDSGYNFILEAFKMSQKIGYQKGELVSTGAISRYWWTVGEYATAIKLLLPRLKDIENLEDNYTAAYLLGIISDSYRDQRYYDEAIKYNLKCIDKLKKIPGCFACRITHFALASNYLGKKNLDSAKLYFRIAYSYPVDVGLQGWPLFIVGKAFALEKKYDSALFYYRQSIFFLTEENNLKDLSDAYNHIASLYKITGNIDSSIFYLHRSLSVSQHNRFAKESMEALLQLSVSFERLNTDSALYYYKEAIVAKDSLYNQDKQRQILGSQFNELLKQQELQNKEIQYKSRIRINILWGATGSLLLIGFVLWRNNRHKQKAKEQIEKTYTELKLTQQQLIQSEKMASLGELTAGIAHEIQNPLNFVNNFSEVNDELIKELKAEAEKGNLEDVKAIANDIAFNSEKINHHGKRADGIVKGMLQHSRRSSGQKEPTDINALCDEYLRLAYHGLRAKDKSFNATTKTEFDSSIEKTNVNPQDMGRVILNLINNAFYAVDEKKKQAGDGYDPIVSVSTNKKRDKVEIKVKDNGNGIPQKVLDKIFQPFFTTKPTGQGTGLGLSLAYDIITKGHGGDLKVETKEGEGSEFIIQLPA